MVTVSAPPCVCVCVCEQVPSSEEAVTPSSAVTPSASGASSRPFIPVTDDPGAASIIAETMAKTKEVSPSVLCLFRSDFADVPCSPLRTKLHFNTSAP